MTDVEWKDRVKGLLKGELKRRNITYEELAKRLNEIDIEEKAENINLKIHRGGFSAVFLIQCLDVIGCKNLRLED